MTERRTEQNVRSESSDLATLAATDHAAELRRYLYRRLGGVQEVEDVAQQVYLKLLRINDGLRVEKPLAFIYSVAAKVLADHRAAAAHNRSLLSSSDIPDEIEQRVSESLSERLEENLAIRQTLEDALARIPPKHAAVLIMVKRDGMSYQEVAAKMKVSTHAVHKYLREGRALLRRLRWAAEGESR